MLAMVGSMTPRERAYPDLIKSSRKRRIAAGSGTEVQDVNRLLKQHQQMKKMMKKFSKGGMTKMMRAMQGQMKGGGNPLPPGMGR
jgi:signal recognition particle subunit SRP54